MKRKKIDKELRWSLYEQSNRRCGYCGGKIGFSEVTVDHKIPLSRGGPDCRDNMICACRPCNSFKGDRTVEEFRGLVSQANHNLMQKSESYRCAIRFGLLREHRRRRILFYYERSSGGKRR